VVKCRKTGREQPMGPTDGLLRSSRVQLGSAARCGPAKVPRRPGGWGGSGSRRAAFLRSPRKSLRSIPGSGSGRSSHGGIF
jgi:hypothetical protein